MLIGDVIIGVTEEEIKKEIEQRFGVKIETIGIYKDPNGLKIETKSKRSAVCLFKSSSISLNIYYHTKRKSYFVYFGEEHLSTRYK